MGKVSDNEQIKLKAAYFNNIAVGLAVGGVLIPYLAIIAKGPTIVMWILEVWNGTTAVSRHDAFKIFFTAFAILIPLVLAKMAQDIAQDTIAKVTD